MFDCDAGTKLSVLQRWGLLLMYIWPPFLQSLFWEGFLYGGRIESLTPPPHPSRIPAPVVNPTTSSLSTHLTGDEVWWAMSLNPWLAEGKYTVAAWLTWLWWEEGEMGAEEERIRCYRRKQAGDGIEKLYDWGICTISSADRIFCPMLTAFCLFSRKWDWLTTTPIMPGTTAPTWHSLIAVVLPYFQSFSLGTRGWCIMFMSAGHCASS